MRINKPLSEKQMKEGDLWPKGNYFFKVLEAEEAKSQSGNDMIKLKLQISNEEGRTKVVFDYLLEALEYKLAHFTEACGLFSTYQEGALSAYDCLDKRGELKLTIQQDKTGQYGDKNVVADYLLSEEASAKKFEQIVSQNKNQVDPDFDDETPF